MTTGRIWEVPYMAFNAKKSALPYLNLVVKVNPIRKLNYSSCGVVYKHMKEEEGQRIKETVTVTLTNSALSKLLR